MNCKLCKIQMKELSNITNKWIQQNYYWCSECGSVLKIEHSVKKIETWLHPTNKK